MLIIPAFISDLNNLLPNLKVGSPIPISSNYTPPSSGIIYVRGVAEAVSNYITINNGLWISSGTATVVDWEIYTHSIVFKGKNVTYTVGGATILQALFFPFI